MQIACMEVSIKTINRTQSTEIYEPGQRHDTEKIIFYHVTCKTENQLKREQKGHMYQVTRDTRTTGENDLFLFVKQ